MKCSGRNMLPFRKLQIGHGKTVLLSIFRKSEARNRCKFVTWRMTLSPCHFRTMASVSNRNMLHLKSAVSPDAVYRFHERVVKLFVLTPTGSCRVRVSRYYCCCPCRDVAVKSQAAKSPPSAASLQDVHTFQLQSARNVICRLV